MRLIDPVSSTGRGSGQTVEIAMTCPGGGEVWVKVRVRQRLDKHWSGKYAQSVDADVEDWRGACDPIWEYAP